VTAEERQYIREVVDLRRRLAMVEEYSEQRIYRLKTDLKRARKRIAELEVNPGPEEVRKLRHERNEALRQLDLWKKRALRRLAA
jgi:hypothetical protein